MRTGYVMQKSMKTQFAFGESLAAFGSAQSFAEGKSRRQGSPQRLKDTKREKIGGETAAASRRTPKKPQTTQKGNAGWRKDKSERTTEHTEGTEKGKKDKE